MTTENTSGVNHEIEVTVDEKTCNEKMMEEKRDKMNVSNGRRQGSLNVGTGVDASSMTICGRSRVEAELELLRNSNLAKTHKDKYKGSK